jgi:hypothetical protein
MRRFLVIVPVVLALMVSGMPAMAKPAELQGVFQASEPYGRSSLRWLFLKAYDVHLWTDAPVWSMQAPFALSIRYNMGFTSEELVERTLAEMKKIDPALSGGRLAQFSAPLSRVLPAVKSGDRISALYVPGRPVRFFFNGQVSGEMDAGEFAMAFFGIWLSPRSSEPSVRRELLRLG